jgi:hypothetical protein
MTDYPGGQQYGIGGKDIKSQADSIIAALGEWYKTHTAEHAVVWLNPCMMPAGTVVDRITGPHITVRYDESVKPAATTCGITEGER